MSRPFLERLARHSAMGDLDRCFPLPVLSLEASVQHFYDLYDISASISVSRPV